MAYSHGNRRYGEMTQLVTAMRGLGLDGEVALAGRWITIRGERGLVHVLEIPWRGGFSTWCDLAGARTVERYADATDAIRAGLRRAEN
jgi:hypothetical protein